MKTWPKAPVIKETTNYELFEMENNRDISGSNVSKFETLAREDFQFHNNPIIVDKDMRIMDGQHRYLACMNMLAPIYYVIDRKNDSSCEHIFRLNLGGKSHSVADKITMLAGVKGAKYDPYRLALEVWESNDRRFTLPTIAKLYHLTPDALCVGISINNIINGVKLNSKNIEAGNNIMRFVEDLNFEVVNCPNVKYRDGFVIALSYAQVRSGVTTRSFFKKIKELEWKIGKRPTVEAYISMFISIYNYRLKNKVKQYYPELGA